MFRWHFTLSIETGRRDESKRNDDIPAIKLHKTDCKELDRITEGDVPSQKPGSYSKSGWNDGLNSLETFRIEK